MSISNEFFYVYVNEIIIQYVHVQYIVSEPCALNIFY